MRSETKSTSTTPTRRSTPSTRSTPSPTGRKRPESAFSAAFLAQIVRLSEPPEQAEALFSGEWTVEPVERDDGTVQAVVRRDEPLAEGGGAVAVFRDRSTALQLAAALPASGGRNRLSLNRAGWKGRTTGRRKVGVPLHDGGDFLGHVSPRLLPGAADEEEGGLLASLHAVRSLAANPQALALLLESLGPEVLPVVGRALMRRIERVTKVQREGRRG